MLQSLRIKIIIILLSISGSTSIAWSQSKSFPALEKRVKALLVPSRSFDALKLIDSCLQLDPTPFTEAEHTFFEVARVEALQESHQLDLALNYSRGLLKSRRKSAHTRVEIRLWRALCYELLADFEKCKKELDQCKELLKDSPSDYLESILFYRTSSYYRVKENPNDSLAVNYAQRSKKLALSSGNVDAAAISSLLLGFYSEGAKHEYHIRETLKYWKELHDIHGVSYMFLSISKIHVGRGELDSALIYIDSAIFYCQQELKTNSRMEDALAISFQRKSDTYERMGQLDSSIVYLKKSREYSRSEAQSKLIESVKRLEYKYAQEEQSELITSQQEELSEKRRERRSLIMGIVLLVILVVTILYLLKKIIGKNQQLDEQNLELIALVDNKETLFIEVNHRVKNNLAMILSLMEIQIEKEANEEMRGSIDDLRQRVYAIAGTHSALIGEYKDGTGSEFINIERYINIIIAPYHDELTMTCQIHDEVKLTLVKGVPLGILVNELMTNSVKHAKPEKDKLYRLLIPCSG